MFVGIDASDGPRPTRGNRKKPRLSRPDPGAMRPSLQANGMDPIPLLLAIPAEIRLQVYELLLVSQLNPKRQYSAWMIGRTHQQKIALQPHAPRFRSLDLGILGTCKKIYNEATPVLYGRNVFSFGDPERMFQVMSLIGPTNTKMIRSLDLWVPWQADHNAWLSLLRAFARDATGLQSIDIMFTTNCHYPASFAKGRVERGLGDDVPFIRAFAKIQTLQKILIRGSYAKNWPSYLETETGAQVRAERGYHTEPLPTDRDWDVKWVRRLNENSLEVFIAYQVGTEDIIP